MDSNQRAGSTSEVGYIKVPKKGSANESEAGSTFVATNRENAFVSGALQDSEDSLNPRAASQASDGSDSLVPPTERSSLKALELALSLTNVKLPENQEAVATALPDSIDDGSDVSSSLMSPLQRSSLNALELAPSLANNLFQETQEAVFTALPDSIDGISDFSISLTSSIDRSSLKALELAPSPAYARSSENQEAIFTALPDSIDDISDFSISPTSSVESSSLKALELAPSPAHAGSSENQEAISTFLPESTDGGSSQEFLSLSNYSTAQATGQNLQVVPFPEIYASTIKNLSSHLPHLRNVQEQSLRKNVNVTCYDYADDALGSVVAFSQSGRSFGLQTTEGMSLHQYLRDTPPDKVQLRLIVASDLSTALIECLGTSLSMSPEVYEEHLVNSGWRNGTYNDEEPNTWVTRGMKKSHVSIRWYRPVKRILQQPCSTVERKELLSSETLPFSWTETVLDEHGKPHGVKHQSRPETNILRRDWDISTNAEAAISVGSFAAWEERATIWSKQKGKLRVG